MSLPGSRSDVRVHDRALRRHRRRRLPHRCRRSPRRRSAPGRRPGDAPPATARRSGDGTSRRRRATGDSGRRRRRWQRRPRRRATMTTMVVIRRASADAEPEHRRRRRDRRRWCPSRSHPSHTSRFQTGTDTLRASIAKRAAANACGRCGADTARRPSSHRARGGRPDAPSRSARLRPARPRLRRDLGQLGHDHLVVGLVFEVLDVRSLHADLRLVIPDGAAEQHDRTAIGADAPLVHVTDRQCRRR